MNNLIKQYTLWIVVILIVILAMTQFTQMQNGARPLGERDFVREMDNGNVKAVVIKEAGKNLVQISATLKKKVENQETISFKSNEFKDEWKTALDTFNVDYRFDVDNTILTDLLFSVLPIVLILGLFWFFMFRQMQGGSNKALSFGKSRARIVNRGDKTVTFNDVAGVDEAKEELQEIIEFLRDPKKFTHLGGKIPRGVLLVGAPGSGKTLLARAVAGEANVPFFSISGSDFVEMFVGVGAIRVRDLFQQGHKHAPCIIFIDEIDAVGRQRGAGMGGGHDEREQTLNQLLVEMDGFNTNDGVILMAATNRPDVLDRALLRPGRFDRQVVVPNPDIRGRTAILGIHTRNQKVPMDPDVDLAVLARGTPGFSGADLANMVNEAALLAARRGQDKVNMIDFEDAKDRVLMGPARRSLVMNAKEKLSTAYHEAGHTLVARLSTNADPVHKVTIIPRGMALGVTSSLPSEDRYSISKDYCLATLRVLMAGRAAEEVVFNQYNSGAANDLQRATQLAHKMVCDWGMSALGPLSFGDDTEVFLGRDFARRRDFSEQTATEVDREVHSICKRAYDEAREILEKHQDILKSMAEALVERETLDAHEIDALIRENGGGDLLPPPAPDQTPPPPAPMDPAPVEDGAPAGSSTQAKPDPVPDGAVPETA